MKANFTTASIVAISLLANCSEADEGSVVSIEPNIISAYGQFIQGSGSLDTLQITFVFTDGDGDVGLDYKNPVHKRHPYERSFYYLKATGEKVSSDRLDDGLVAATELISYEDRYFPPFDTLPEFENSCAYENYEVGNESIELYRTENPDRYNFEVSFFVEKTPGNFVRETFSNIVCGPFYGLIPPETVRPFRRRHLGDGKTEIIYDFLSGEWKNIFIDTRIQVEIYIKDRALHQSKSFKTQPFDSF